MKLKWYQKHSGKTIEENAKNLGLPKSTYNNYLREIREPDIKTLCKLADYFNTSIDDLCEHETKENINTNTFSDLKKGCIYVLNKLTENNTAIAFGYITHLLQEQNK